MGTNKDLLHGILLIKRVRDQKLGQVILQKISCIPRIKITMFAWGKKKPAQLRINVKILGQKIS